MSADNARYTLDENIRPQHIKYSQLILVILKLMTNHFQKNEMRIHFRKAKI